MRMEIEELRSKLATCRHDTDVAAVMVEYTKRNYASGSIGHDAGGGHVRVWASREDWDRFRKSTVSPVTSAFQATPFVGPEVQDAIAALAYFFERTS